MCAKMLQSCLTLRDPMDCSPPGSSVHGTLPARILEWVAMPSSRGSSWPRDWTGIVYLSCTGGWLLHHWCHQGSPYLLLLTFALSAVEAIQPPDEICMLWEIRWIRRAPWDQELNCTSCSARGEGRLRQRHFHDFQGPNQERGGGVLASSSLAGAVTVSGYRKKQRRLSSPCLCESQKNKSSDFMFLEINFCGAHARCQQPLKAPSPRSANLRKQSSRWLLWPGSHSQLWQGWGLTFKSLWPMVINRKAREQGQVRYLRGSKNTWRRLTKSPTYLCLDKNQWNLHCL